MNKLRILVKFPTRERPAKFIDTLLGYQNLSENPDEIKYLISKDNDDNSMNGAFLNGQLMEMKNVLVISGYSSNKIHAINRDIGAIYEWDILVLASDDMICQAKGWDNILREEMRSNFPDTDGVLFHWDGDPATKKHDEGKGLNTMCILGRKYYERFGYIYHPTYKSLWCDNEFSDVSRMLNKEFKSDQVLFKHVHPSNTPNLVVDKLMRRTQSYFTEDSQNYYKRKAVNFGL